MKKVRIVLILLFLAGMLFSGWMLVSELLDVKTSSAVAENIAQMVVQTSPQKQTGRAEELPEPPPSTEAPEPVRGAEAEDTAAGVRTEDAPKQTEAPPEPEQPRRELLELEAPITVDFDTLLAECPEAVGWLYCPQINVNCPVMHTVDNFFYLDHLPDTRYGVSGSLFADKDASPDFSDRNTVIYGHNMRNGTMFGSLQRFSSQEFWQSMPEVFLLTPEASYRVDMFAVFVEHIFGQVFDPVTSEQEQASLIAHAMESSLFPPPVTPEPTDRLLTLSTCAYDFDGARFVVIGVLRELADSAH